MLGRQIKKWSGFIDLKQLTYLISLTSPATNLAAVLGLDLLERPIVANELRSRGRTARQQVQINTGKDKVLR